MIFRYKQKKDVVPRRLRQSFVDIRNRMSRYHGTPADPPPYSTHAEGNDYGEGTHEKSDAVRILHAYLHSK